MTTYRIAMVTSEELADYYAGMPPFSPLLVDIEANDKYEAIEKIESMTIFNDDGEEMWILNECDIPTVQEFMDRANRLKIKIKENQIKKIA